MVESGLKRRRQITMVYLYVLCALWGMLPGLFFKASGSQAAIRGAERILLILSLATQLGFVWFCTVDARLVGQPLMQLAQLGIFFGWPIGVPIYLVWARGLRGLATLLLHGVLLALVWGAGLAVAVYFCYGNELFA